MGFTDVRIKVDMAATDVPPAEVDALVQHVIQWSPGFQHLLAPREHGRRPTASKPFDGELRHVGHRRSGAYHVHAGGRRLISRPDSLHPAFARSTAGPIPKTSCAPLALPGHMARMSGAATFWVKTIEAISTVGRTLYLDQRSACGARTRLSWYIASFGQSRARPIWRPRWQTGASGAILGGTGLSNPMKTFFGIEKMRLKGTRVDGGYTVKARCPGCRMWAKTAFSGWCSRPKRRQAYHGRGGLRAGGRENRSGSRVHGHGRHGHPRRQFRDAFIPDEMILADPIDGYLQKIRPGFVLMQCGMADWHDPIVHCKLIAAG